MLDFVVKYKHSYSWFLKMVEFVIITSTHVLEVIKQMLEVTVMLQVKLNVIYDTIDSVVCE